MKKILLATTLAVLSIHTSVAEPGTSYILTGQEKSIEDIVKADMEKYPDLYEGESLGEYVAAFKTENKIGSTKLSPGDELIFPETTVSRSVKKAKAEEEAAKEAEKLRARHEGIYQYQHEFLPNWMLNTGEQTFSSLESGIPQELIRYAKDLVDSDFADSMQLKPYPEKKLYVIVFETPSRSSQCYFSAFKAEDGGRSYFTLEKGITLFDAGDESVLWVMENDGERVKLGSRSYTDLAGFVGEIEQ